MGNLQKIKEFQPLRQNFKIAQAPQKPLKNKINITYISASKP